VSILLFTHLYAAASKVTGRYAKYTHPTVRQNTFCLFIFCARGNAMSAHTPLINSVSRGPNVSL